jgi:hypothetical protein
VTAGTPVGGYEGRQRLTGSSISGGQMCRTLTYPLTVLPAYPLIF